MATSLNFTFEDAKGAKSTTSFSVADTVSLPSLQEIGLSLANLMVALTTGSLVSAQACISIDLTGLVGDNTIQAGSDVEEGARFIWNSVGGFSASNRIPTFDEAFIVPGTRFVDVADEDVEDFIDAIVGGFVTLGDGVVQITDYREADIVSLDNARESFQRSRRVR